MSLRSISSIIIIIAVFILAVVGSFAAARHYNDLSVYDVLQQYNFPVGILPTNVRGYDINRDNGKFKVYLNQICSFKVDRYNLRYRPIITGTITQGQIYDLRGINVKVGFFWLNIQKVRRDGDKLYLSAGFASASFPVGEFNESIDCWN